jgi:hypothetical protein
LPLAAALAARTQRVLREFLRPQLREFSESEAVDWNQRRPQLGGVTRPQEEKAMGKRTKQRPKIGDLQTPVVELTEDEAEAVVGGGAVIQERHPGGQLTQHRFKAQPARHARRGSIIGPNYLPPGTG